ncbi:unnamed protein product [Pocillopora meandrina]|uniref:Uncharacterized protein n=1 Tax=Pocillopora meandrina TaxID=46732 RepID=A0AAU9WD56_9CNID|nr:unnamed protein product [Pocillopora meandrina]
MFQAFAKNYAESITLVYYCFTGLIAFAAFAIGNVYLWKRDQKNQKERTEEEREYQERRYQEESRDHRRREWRQFSDKINADYGKLRNEDILQKISKVKYTFEHMRIHSTVTGLDVLRYMLTDDNYRNLVSESPHLQALREDLHMIFLPLNDCSSLLHLGEVPPYIKEELRFVVEELGNLAKPFLTGEQQRVALKCLEHFCSNRSSNEHGQRGVEGLGVRIKAIVPYVNSLQFISMEDCDYSKCKKFSFNLKESIMFNNLGNLKFLGELLEYLEGVALGVRVFKEQPAELPVKSIELINDSDSDEVILMKVLHEVRLYIHLILNENLSSEDNERVERNIKRLRQLYVKGGKEIESEEEKIKTFCHRFILDLQRIKDEIPPHLIKQGFGTQLEDLYLNQLCQMILVKNPGSGGSVV